MLLSHRWMNLKSNNYYFWIRDEYTKEVFKSDSSIILPYTWTRQNLTIIHNSLKNPLLAHFRHSNITRKDKWDWQTLINWNNKKINNDFLYKWMLNNKWEFIREVDFLPEIK